jgi:hypothetical protein
MAIAEARTRPKRSDAGLRLLQQPLQMLLIFLSIQESSARIFLSTDALPAAEPVVTDPEDCAVPAELVPGGPGIFTFGAPVVLLLLPVAVPVVTPAAPLPELPTLPLCAAACSGSSNAPAMMREHDLRMRNLPLGS